MVVILWGWVQADSMVVVALRMKPIQLSHPSPRDNPLVFRTRCIRVIRVDCRIEEGSV